MKNKQFYTSAQCQIIWFPWKVEDVTDYKMSEYESADYAELADSEMKDISNHLLSSFTFTKTRGDAAGSFVFDLDNSRDWKDIMKPGQWLAVCLSNDGDLVLPSNEKDGDDLKSLPDFDAKNFKKDKLRALLYVERVSCNTEIGEDDGLGVRYEVSGRDFGVIYQETVIWLNSFIHESLDLNLLLDHLKGPYSGNIDSLLSIVHDMFYAPNKLVQELPEASKIFGEASLQWLMPKKLFTTLKLPTSGNYTFWGNVEQVKRFSPSISTIVQLGIMGYINGNCWDRLKGFSVKELHELFTEIDNEGNPALFFRPIPWGISDKGYRDITRILKQKNQDAPEHLQATLSYLEFAESNGIPLSSEKILSTSLGEDGFNRFNHFFADSDAFSKQPLASIDVLSKISGPPANRRYPYPSRASIRRHGFKPMHVQVDSLGQFSEKDDVPSDILYQVNELLYDYWANAVYFESGNLTIIGQNDIKLGQVLDIEEDAIYVGGKVFYIEGYVDTFQVDGGNKVWMQNITVSRGIEKKDLQKMSDKVVRKFSKRENTFTQKAAFLGDKKK